MDDFVIRQADQSQLSIVRRTMREAFKEYAGKLRPESGALRETVEDIARKIADNGGAVIVWHGSEPAGSAQYAYRDDYMYIGRVSVIPKYRGVGLGQKLLSYLEEEAKRNGCRETRLEARLSVPDNIRYYERLHYERIEERHYPEGTDSWYVMLKIFVIALLFL